MRIIYLGTPDFSIKPLENLLQKHEILAVVTQPDREAGRGKKVMPTPVKVFAQNNNIEVLQYENINKEGYEYLSYLNPDIMVTAAYGQILSEKILSIPKYGIINIHASLLPKYRGAAPIQWAIINGEKQTGVTIMQTAKGMDTGDILLQKCIDIAADDTTQTLTDKLSNLGAEAVVEALSLIEKGEIKSVSQDDSIATYAPRLKKEDGKINFDLPAHKVNNHIRGVIPFPTAYTTKWGEIFKIWEAEVLEKSYPVKPGTIINTDKTIIVACGEGSLKIKRIQLLGGKIMSAEEYLRGHKIYVGERFE